MIKGIKQSLMIFLICLVFSLLGCSAIQHTPKAAHEVEVFPKEPSPELKPEIRELELEPKFEEDVLKQKQAMKGLFKTSLDIVEADGKLTITFSLTNLSGKDLQITHGSGQQYDILIFNDQDEEVYKWSNNKAFTQALIGRELKRSEQLDFEEEWNLTDNNGDYVPAGAYTVVVEMMVGLESGIISRDELIAQSTIETS